MPNQRATGKKLIGAQATPELHAAIERWLRKDPRRSITQFITEACLEKLSAEKIPVNEAEVYKDGRRRPL